MPLLWSVPNLDREAGERAIKHKEEKRMQLVKPDMRYDASIQAFRREFLDAGDSMDGSAHLRHFDRTSSWLAQLDPLERSISLSGRRTGRYAGCCRSVPG